MLGRKVVFIIGTTAVGKSKLGIELAQRFSGEIISADSMQVYAHLDIGSAKVSEQEQQGIPHHLISILQPTHTEFSVKEFSGLARSKIEHIHKGKLPIVVGGTFYYVESLLWKSFLSMNQQVEDEEEGDFEERKERLEGMKKLGISEHDILREIDPMMANRLHPNDARKVQRSLEVWLKSGKKHSEQIVAARGESDDIDLQLFYDNCCVIWIDAEKDTLDDRLNKRVDRMINQGLIEEVKDLYKILKGQHTSTGLAQSIGYKEFLPYLELIDGKSFQEEADPVKYQKMLNEKLEECIETLKRATRRYARKQLQWIRNRVLGGPGANTLAPKLFRFDSSNIDSWNANVLNPSIEVVDAFLRDDLSRFDPKNFQEYNKNLALLETSKYTMDNLVENWENYECKVCNKAIHGKHEYDIHMDSKKHKLAIRRLERAPIIEKYKKMKVAKSNEE